MLDFQDLQDLLEKIVVEFSSIVGKDLDRAAIYGDVVVGESLRNSCCLLVGNGDGRKKRVKLSRIVKM